MKLSVVIVTYNSAKCIAECVRAIRRVFPDCEVIVVDNMSVDLTLAIATATDPLVGVLQMGRNAGFGRACNEGVQRARHDHVLLMNPDVVLGAATHTELEAAFAKGSFGLMAPELIEAPRGPAQAQLFGSRSWLGELLHMAFGPFEPRELSRRRRTGRTGAPVWASGALLLVRRSEFLRLGGFDERFFLYYEDQELGMRYREANLPIQSMAALRGSHLRGASSLGVTEDRLDAMAWCVLGWLEFVAMCHGRERARRSWAIVRRAHRAGRAVASLLARGSSTGRIGRKAEQMASLEESIREIASQAPDLADGFCPIARRVVADVS